MTFGPLQPSTPPCIQYIDTSMYLEIIAVLHYNNHDAVFHARALKSV